MAIKGNGSTGWTASGIAIQAGSQAGYTMACWGRYPATPAAEAAFLSWSGAQFVHTSFHAETSPGINLFDIDNAFTSSQNGIGNTFGAWQPIVLSKIGQSSRTLYVNSSGNSVTDTTAISTQTLTDLFVGSNELNANPLQAVASVAEVALWDYPLGTDEVDRYMSGVSSLKIGMGHLICYFPLRFNLKNYTSRVASLVGVSPTFTDHPLVENYNDVILRRKKAIVAMLPNTRYDMIQTRL